MFKKIKQLQSYEYAARNWKNFIINRLLALALDMLQMTAIITGCVIVSWAIMFLTSKG